MSCQLIKISNVRRSRGFTFIEVMVTVVVLSLGAVGLFRAFLISLNYQKYLMARLQVVNLLSNDFSEAENKLLTGQQLPEGPSEQGQSMFHLNPVSSSEEEELFAGLNYLTVSHQLTINGNDQIFARGSFIYVKE